MSRNGVRGPERDTGPAAPQPAGGQPQAPAGAVAPHRLQAVGAARRGVPAAGRQAGRDPAVATDGGEHGGVGARAARAGAGATEPGESEQQAAQQTEVAARQITEVTVAVAAVEPAALALAASLG